MSEDHGRDVGRAVDAYRALQTAGSGRDAERELRRLFRKLTGRGIADVIGVLSGDGKGSEKAPAQPAEKAPRVMTKERAREVILGHAERDEDEDMSEEDCEDWEWEDDAELSKNEKRLKAIGRPGDVVRYVRGLLEILEVAPGTDTRVQVVNVLPRDYTRSLGFVLSVKKDKDSYARMEIDAAPIPMSEESSSVPLALGRLLVQLRDWLKDLDREAEAVLLALQKEARLTDDEVRMVTEEDV